MNFKLQAKLVIIALLSLTCSAQTRSRADLFLGIRNGDTAAIYDAGRTGDATLIPALREKLKQADRTERDALKMALGKLGDTHELQVFYCNARKSLGLQLDSRALEYIGGGFSIRLLGMLMDLDSEFKKAKLPESNDIEFDPPSWSALYELPRIVPNPPLKNGSPSPEEHDQAVQVWRTWINSHSDEINQLQPNGTGVIFSKSACRGLKQRR
jgi:hypothetical protein